MNETPAPTPPLPPDQVDELLSADLDGAFDAAAIDLGFTPAVARARLAATPDVDGRRAALTAARDRLAEPPAVDEVLAARLRANALDAARADRTADAERHRHRGRMLSLVGGIAAAIVAAIAVGTVVSRHSSSSARVEASANGAAVAAPPTSSSHPVAISGASFGSFKTAAALADHLRTSVVLGKSEQFASDGRGAPASVAATPAAVPVASRCGAAADTYADAHNPVRTGTATVAGRPVEVRFYARGTGHVVIVLTPGCTLVTEQVLP
jgi:hypothetical protein